MAPAGRHSIASGASHWGRSKDIEQPREGRHTARYAEPPMPSTHTKLLYHIIFSTKERRPFINAKLRDELYPYIGGIIREARGEPIEIGGVADHVHILTRLPATLAVADALRLIKSNSSKWAGERFDLVRTFAWQTGYAAFTVSKSQVGTVRQYIENQELHHRRKTFQQELISLLKKNNIEYDERYLWD